MKKSTSDPSIPTRDKGDYMRFKTETAEEDVSHPYTSFTVSDIPTFQRPPFSSSSTAKTENYGNTFTNNYNPYNSIFASGRNPYNSTFTSSQIPSPPPMHPHTNNNNTFTTNDSSVFVKSPSRFLTAPRLVATTKSKSLVPQDSRPTDITKLTKLRESATTPLVHKFGSIPLDDSDEQVVNNYNLAMRINELHQKLVKFDMVEVFNILQFPSVIPSQSLLNTSVAGQPLSETIDLLNKYSTITEEDVFTHIKFLRLYGQEWDLQNLDWSQELLQESSEVDLANKVQEDLLGVPSEYECGPLYFFYMMKRIISSSEDAVVSLISKVKGMRIMDFEGENVPKATGQIKLAIKRLEILDKVPADIERIVLDVLQTTSVPEFNGFFKQLHTNLKQLPNFILSTSKVLAMANSQYNELLQIGTWTGIKRKPATFNAGMDIGGGTKCSTYT